VRTTSMFWNQGQKELIGSAFIPENQPPINFNEAPLPSSFNFDGNAYRKCGLSAAIRLDSETVHLFKGNELIYPQTNTKSVWQNSFGVRSWG
jgi:hypothetical protein